MKKFFSLVWISSLTTMLILTACSKNQQLTTSAENPVEDEISLDKEFGGYETNDEPAAFGDSEIADNFTDDIAVADNFALDAQVSDAIDPARVTDAVKARFLRITWGLLEGDSSATEVIDWSGSAQVSKGILVVLKTIRFEANDYIVLPRENRQLIEFTSQTVPHFDGLLLAIVDNDTTDEEGTFTLQAGEYSKTLTFSELDSIDLIEPVGSLGHEVSIISRCKEVVPFGGGFMSGHWVRTSPLGGVFKGRFMTGDGENAGHLRGIWGVNRFGQKVFKGKMIDINGNFRALMAGHWGHRRGADVGYFSGRIVNRQRNTIGKVQGHFKAGRPGSRRGFFHGRFKLGQIQDAAGDNNTDDSNG